MSKFLLEAYDALTEIALWLLFIAAVIGGFYAGGIAGAIGFVVLAFISSVFMVAPFMMISDIRKSVARIEKQNSQNTSSPTATSAEVRSNVDQASGTNQMAQRSSPGHIKNFKGYELTRGSGGVYVNGIQFSNVLEAEKWINEQVKNA